MKKTIKATLLAFVAVFLFTGMFYSNDMTSQAAGKTTTKVSAKRSTKVVKLRKAAKRRTTKKVSTKNNTKKYKENDYQVTRKTTVKTTTVTKYRAKKKTISTTVRTTVKTTKEKMAAEKAGTSKALVNANGKLYDNNDNSNGGSMGIESLSGIVDPMVIKAFEAMDYKIVIKSSVAYAGMFDARNRQITLRSANTGYLLHEVGHYVSFITGLKDSTAEFMSIYSKEASAYTGSNKAYVTKNNKEYFAESFRDFYTSPSTLKSTRPATYNYIKGCVDSITDETINYINAAYYAA